MASASVDQTVRYWPLDGNVSRESSILAEGKIWLSVAASPDGNKLLPTQNGGELALLSLDGSPPINLDGFRGQTWGVDFSMDGRLVAVAGGLWEPEEREIRVWETSTGNEIALLEFEELPAVETIEFVADDGLLSATETGLWLWDIKAQERSLVYEGLVAFFSASEDGKTVVIVKPQKRMEIYGTVVLLDTRTGKTTELSRFGDEVYFAKLGPGDAMIATGGRDGIVRVGRIDGTEPHLLLGHSDEIHAIDFDPLGRWIASTSMDKSIRLWPMPDLTKPPLHTLPREELIAKLKTLTNLRVVRDPESATGWKLTHDPFPGWETVPTW